MRFAVAILTCVGPLLAHDPVTTKITWTQEISRIVENRCLRCHGETSKIPLATYAEARPWAKAIRDQVLSRQMPPWGAVHGVGQFRNDPSLTAGELERIVQWVEGTAPEGDPIYLPVFRTPPTPAPVRLGAPLKVFHSITLDRDRTFAAIRPDSPLEAIAVYPDGRVEHLIWLKDFHNLTYSFLDPVRLPKGATIRVTRGSATLFNVAPVSTVARH